MTTIRVLVVDDEPGIRRFLRSALAISDYAVIEAQSGAEAIALVRSEEPDLVILDLGLPDMDGEAVLAALRAFTPVPILVLSARGDEGGKVRVLDLGADDYVVKPFGVEELLARARAALRHRLQQSGQVPVLVLGAIELDLVRRLVSRDGVPVKLSRKEFELLRLLAEHLGKVVSHRQILGAVWGDAHLDDVEYLRVYMRQLRGKLEPDPQRPVHLLTEPGVGYRLVSGT
jgi:two-component system KDP operon response regulator KdpE